MKTALLLSGGIDSIALAYWVRPSICITLDYGQVPAQGEVQAAQAVCRDLNLPHEALRIDCSLLGSGDLAGSEASEFAPVREWWPFRNQLLITLSASRVLERGCQTLLMGTVASDGVHADGAPAFFSAISSAMELQEGHIRVEAPAIQLSSAELVKSSRVPFEILAWAHSCHTSNLACGHCRGCGKHYLTMKELGLGPY